MTTVETEATTVEDNEKRVSSTSIIEGAIILVFLLTNQMMILFSSKEGILLFVSTREARRDSINANLGYASPNNKVYDNTYRAIASRMVLKYVDDRKKKSHFHFELFVLINLLFLSLRYLDDNNRVDRTIGK